MAAQSTYSLAFDGSSGYVSFSRVTLPGAGWSVSWWQKLDLSDVTQAPIGETTGTSNLIFFSVGNYMLIRDNVGGQDVSVVGGATSPGSAWTHWAITNSVAGLLIYKDGSLIDTLSQMGAFAPDNLGAVDSTGQFFGGQMDDVAFFASVLTAGQIANIAGTPGVVGSSSLDVGTLTTAGLWRAEAGTGTTLTDTSGNGNNGTFSGGVTWSSLNDVPLPLQVGGGGGGNRRRRVLICAGGY